MYVCFNVCKCEYVCVCMYVYVRVCVIHCVCIIDIKKVGKQLTHAMHRKDIYANGTFIDKLTKWHQ